MKTSFVIGLGSALIAMAASADEAAVSYRTQLQPIFNAQCVYCHVTGAENGGLNLARASSYASLVGTASTESPLMRVTPGQPDKSYLWHKLNGSHVSVGGSGNAMPMSDPPRLLEPAQRALFKAWIEAGAPNN
ncbi:c-type cytochrome domain-containing protein [Nevskia ramosa]|uniref:c-type cytochrome domain-containing protein n=1 Tax=Nevskia ramosa TaxID=64002 RepID=UPI00235203FC|nr:c-type cytochrome domain-containing protein [Nevskia ramosa]